jgi:uncharacterized protein with ParB-like and HNH nuclease domain
MSINKDIIEVASCTLADLLKSWESKIPETEIKGQLKIPEYQRPYVWGEKQINNLLNDWIEHCKLEKSKPLFYLGSIILHKDDSNNLNIIDGQQRITTALLFQKFKTEKIKSNIAHHNSSSIEQIKKNLSYLKAIKNQDIFEYSELDVIDTIRFEQINVTLVVTHNEDLAYTFFETQNSGGVRLSGSDILKAHHLRAIESTKMVNYQARKWETYDNKDVEYVIQLLTKIRFWDNRHWKRFPFYRDEKGIKQSITEEFTLNTNSNKEDISYHYSAVKKDGERLLQMHESSYKMLKQPLSDGNNAIDYIKDYINLYYVLFEQDTHHQIDDNFYEFRNALINGNNGTIFLKELFEISTIAYVSRFGYYRLYDAALWLFRVIYSLRVSNARNVREDSLFKFVYEKQLIDNILEVFTPDELFNFLKKMRYNFDTSYLVEKDEEMNTVKTRFISSLATYFTGIKKSKHYYHDKANFDKDLKKAINEKLTSNERD